MEGNGERGRMMTTNLTRHTAFAQILCHQAIFQVGKASTFLEVVLGEEHVPQSELAGLGLEILEDGGGCCPS